MKRRLLTLLALLTVVGLLAGCPAPTPQVIEKEVVVEKPVVETVVVEKEVVVEKPVVETVVVEKEKKVVVTPTPPEPVTITIWHGIVGAYLESYEMAADAYMAAHPHVTIELVHTADFQQAALTAIPAGEGPDIIAWANDWIGRYALTKAIVPLDDYIDKDWFEGYYEPAAKAAMKFQGKIWGLPYRQEAILLVYNKALISEEDLPADPLDFDDLMAKAKAFQEAHPGVYYLCNQGLGNPDAYHVAPIYHGFGGWYVNDEGEVGLTTPETLAAAKWIAEFKEISPAETGHEICMAMLAEGKAAIWWTGPWAIKSIADAGIDYGLQPMGSPFVGVHCFMMTANAVERGKAEETIEVMKYLTSAGVWKRMAVINKEVPAATEALQDPDVQAMYEIKQFGASAALGVPMPSTPFMGCMWGPVGDATMAIWTGAQTPEEAMEAAKATAEECIAGMKD